MSSKKAESSASSRPVFPYAVLQEKEPTGRKWILVLVVVLAVVAVAGLLLVG